MIRQRNRSPVARLAPLLLLFAASALLGCLEPDCAPETFVITPATAGDAGDGDGGPDACLAICDNAPERPSNKFASSCEVVAEGISCTYIQFCEG